MINGQSQHFPPSFHRVSVKGICVHEDKVMLVKEPPELSGKWELPGGGLDFGEDIQIGLKREVEEELGLNIVSVSDKPLYVWTALFEGWRNMDWYYSLVLAYKIELENFDFTTSDECESIGFFKEDELTDLDIFLQSAPLKKVFKISDFH